MQVTPLLTFSCRSLIFLDLSSRQSGLAACGVGPGSGSGDFSGWASPSSSCPQNDFPPNSLWTIFSAFSRRRPSWEEKSGLTEKQLGQSHGDSELQSRGLKWGEGVTGLGRVLWAPQGPPGPKQRGTTFSDHQVPHLLGKCRSAEILTNSLGPGSLITTSGKSSLNFHINPFPHFSPPEQIHHSFL